MPAEADEFSLIDRLTGGLPADPRVLLSVGDDAALLAPPPGEALVVSSDALVAGVHVPAFPDLAGADPDAVEAFGHKAMAVNLSDLAAMAATPLACTVCLTLPEAAVVFAEALYRGLRAVADRHGCALVGGDLTRGPLAVAITVLGSVPPALATRRDGARPGMDLWLTGIPGEAAVALRLRQSGRPVPPELARRLDRPEPRVAFAVAARGLVGAAIDVSDGLLADLGHVAALSGVAIEVEAACLPVSPALAGCGLPESDWRALQRTGGDDYELALAVAPASVPALLAVAKATGTQITRIGRITAGSGVVVRGAPADPVAGYRHFA